MPHHQVMCTLYRFPFDWKTPIGYLTAITMQYVAVRFVCFFGAVLCAFEIGFYLWTMGLIEDIGNDISSFNDMAKSQKNEGQTAERLRNSIEFHLNVKELSIFKTKSNYNFIFIRIFVFIFSSFLLQIKACLWAREYN